MDFRLRHPTESQTYAVYGFDPKRGYWVEVVQPLNLESYDSKIGQFESVTHYWIRDKYDALSDKYEVANPIRGLLIRLSEQGFFPFDDVCDALEIIDEQGIDNLPRRLRRIAHIIANLDSGLA